MRAVLMTGVGGPEVLRLSEVPQPEIVGEHDVRVRLSDLVSNVESPWEEEAITAMHDRNLRVSFTWMPAPSVFGWPEHRERQRAILEEAGGHFDRGDLRIAVGATFPLEQAADAHRALEAGQVVGKVVLEIE